MTYPAAPLDIRPVRRHRDPSILWITVLSGSLAIHLLLLLLLRISWGSNQAQPQYSEIALEFVESPPADTAPTSPPIAAAPTEPPTEAPIAPEPTAPEPEPETEVPVSTTVPFAAPDTAPEFAEPEPTAIAPPAQPAPQPTSRVQPPVPLPRNPAPVPQPSVASTIPPQSNPVPPARPNPPTTAPPPLAPVPSNDPIASGQILPPVPDISRDIDPTTQPTIAATDPTTSTDPSAVATGQGTGLKLAAGTPVRVNTQKDILTTQQGVPDQEATLLGDRPVDETAVYPPTVGLNLGKPVKLWVLVNQQGKAERVEVRQSSGIPEYDDWAKQLGRQLQFQPASQAGQPVASEVELEVSLEPL